LLVTAGLGGQRRICRAGVGFPRNGTPTTRYPDGNRAQRGTTTTPRPPPTRAAPDSDSLASCATAGVKPAAAHAICTSWRYERPTRSRIEDFGESLTRLSLWLGLRWPPASEPALGAVARGHQRALESATHALIAITSCALAYWACSTQQTEPTRGNRPRASNPTPRCDKSVTTRRVAGISGRRARRGGKPCSTAFFGV